MYFSERLCCFCEDKDVHSLSFFLFRLCFNSVSRALCSGWIPQNVAKQCRVIQKQGFEKITKKQFMEMLGMVWGEVRAAEFVEKCNLFLKTRVQENKQKKGTPKGRIGGK